MTSDNQPFSIVEKSKSAFIPLKLILPITAIGTFMSAMDGSIVNVSLATIAKDLDTNMEGIFLIVIAYLLVISSFIGIAGMLGDNYGRKKLFQIGMGLFVFGSALCVVSFTLEMLVFARVVQAIGGAGLTANGLALVITFVDPTIRGRAIGLNSLVVASALSSGPVLGGFLSQYIGWTSIFLINIPIGLIGIFLVHRQIPETPRRPNIKIDYLGMIIFIITAFSFVGGVLIVFKDSLTGVFLIIVSIIFGTLFVYLEIRNPKPMISLIILKDRTILTGIFSSFLCYMVYYGMVLLLPFFYQEVLLFSPSQTGLLMIVPPVAMAIMGPIAGLFAEKIDIRKLASFGALLLSVFVLILAQTINLGLYIIVPLVALSAGALTTFTVSNGTSVMNAAPKKDVSVVSGLIGLSRNIGFTLGTTLTSAFFSLFYLMYNPNDITSGQIFTSSYYQSMEQTYLIFALFALLGAGISLLRKSNDTENAHGANTPHSE
ncbi:MAG: MFS transporter [Candidatus Hodarchaeales archaeon]|jgi:EmrB/QacA subfamily drug resistance transporter